MKRKLIRPALVALVIGTALLVAAGIAYATIPDGGGVIHGCYQKNQGTLRVIDTGQAQTCSSSEAPLNWSQTGPKGQQGPQGPQGPSGSSHAYSDYNSTAETLLSPSSRTITSLNLPAGDYVVWATGSVVENSLVDTSGSDYNVKCALDDPDDTAVTASEASADLNYEDAVPYTLVDTMSLPTGGTITVDCTTENGTAGAEVEFNTLVATAVDAVN
jgi:hypothetical protein